MKIGLLVTSHVKYDMPRMKFLNAVATRSLSGCVVRGGCQEYVFRWYKPAILDVMHDSYEFTPLIELVQDNQTSHLGDAFRLADITHILCVQDTMELGPHTMDLAAQADPDADATAACGGQCNIVLYKIDYLMSQRDFILSQRNCSKLQAIKNERHLWEVAPKRREFIGAGCVVIGRGHPYGPTERIKEFYPSLEIVKWKANYGQNMGNLIDVP